MNRYIILLITITLACSGCQRMLPVVVWRPMDFFWFPFYYTVIAFVFGTALSLIYGDRTAKAYFYRNLIFTPLYGFVQVLRAILKSMN